MKRVLFVTTTLAALLALHASAAQAMSCPECCAEWGCGSNGPALDGRQVALPAGLRIGTPAAEDLQHRDGITLNGPALDGRAAPLPAGLGVDGAPEAQFFECTDIANCGMNGRALDGRQVALPAGLSDGAPEAQFFGDKCTDAVNCGVNGPTLDGRQVALPDLAGRAINPLRLPGDDQGVPPADQRWPNSEQDQLVQQ